MTLAETLAYGLESTGLELPEEGVQKLLAYVALLIKWNRVYNLTAIRDPKRMVSHHLLDSLAVLPHLPAGSLADIGSGGGFPGVPIAIAQPSRKVVLNDSNHKKAAFLTQVKIELTLPNVEVHIGRVEAWRPIPRFDGAISRAFAELADFISACQHVVEPGGFLAAMKGGYPQDELTRLPVNVKCSTPIRLEVPSIRGVRHLVLCAQAG